MKSKEKTVHNLAIYFYAEREKPEELLNYLKQEEAKKQEGHQIYFEVDYALNVCKQKEKDMKEKLDKMLERARKERIDDKRKDRHEKKMKETINSMKKA